MPKKRKRPKYTKGLTQAQRRINLEQKISRFLYLVCDEGFTLQEVATDEGCTRAYVQRLLKNEPKYILAMRQRVTPARHQVAKSNFSVSKEVQALRSELIPVYFSQGFSDEAIGEALGMTAKQVNKWLLDNKLRLRKKGRKTNEEKGIESRDKKRNPRLAGQKRIYTRTQNAELR